MIRSLVLGGLDAQLAADVDLYSALDVPIGELPEDLPVAGASGVAQDSQFVHESGSEEMEDKEAFHSAPATPLGPFTSSAMAPITPAHVASIPSSQDGSDHDEYDEVEAGTPPEGDSGAAMDQPGLQRDTSGCVDGTSEELESLAGQGPMASELADKPTAVGPVGSGSVTADKPTTVGPVGWAADKPTKVGPADCASGSTPKEMSSSEDEEEKGLLVTSSMARLAWLMSIRNETEGDSMHEDRSDTSKDGDEMNTKVTDDCIVLEPSAMDDTAAASTSLVELVQEKGITKADEGTSLAPRASSARLAARKDAPVVRSPGRGSLKRALAAGMASKRKKTMAALQRDEVAPSGVGPRKSRWSTWCKLHQNWFGASSPPLPLTPASIAAVMSQLKEGRYSAAADYMSTAKAMHLKHHEWSTRLARQHTVCVRSALRGMGPGQTCQEITLDDFTRGADALRDDPSITVGLCFTCVIAFFFMLRELELSTMLLKSVTICAVKLTVTILLPASKTDPEALSCSRTWGCVCDKPDEPDSLCCPVHAAMAQRALLERTFGDRAKDDGFPFAPTVTGGTASKAQVVSGIQKVATKLGYKLVNEMGKLNFTGKVWRIGGARHMIRHQVGVPLIMLMARWDSHAVLIYVKDAPLINITTEYKKGSKVMITAGDEKEKKKLTGQFNSKIMKQLTDLQAEVKQHEEELDKLLKQVKVVESISSPLYVVSDKYKKWHITFPFHDSPKKEWRVRCGWRYGCSIFERRSTVPLDLDRAVYICGTCFNENADNVDSDAD